MIDALKWQIRSWEQQGRYEGLTRAATIGWLSLSNMRDRAKIDRVRADLKHNRLPKNVDDAVDAVCADPFGAGIRPMQEPIELAGLIQQIADRKPKTILEIGTARGGTLLLMCRFAAPDATIISVDLPYGRNGGGYPTWKEPYYQDFAQREQNLHLLRADSHASSTIDRIRDILGDEMLDFILIDADHSYEGVRRDYENYRPLLSPNGLIALHDVLPNERDPSIDVNRFWAELEADDQVQTSTIVADPNQGMYGIGLVHA